MSKEIKITIPSEISVGDYIKFGTLDHLTTTERIIRIVSVIADRTEDEVKRWDLSDITKIYSDLSNRITDIKPTFLPIFVYNGTTYGFQPIHKMKGGEFIDLESKLEGGVTSLAEVLSILYRPITKNKLDGLEWKIKNNLKYVVGKSENLFKYYDIEEYDTSESNRRVMMFSELPIQIGLGAYSFFLSIGEIYLANSKTSLVKLSKKMKKSEKKAFLQLLNIMDGSIHSTTSQEKEESSD